MLPGKEKVEIGWGLLVIAQNVRKKTGWEKGFFRFFKKKIQRI